MVKHTQTIRPDIADDKLLEFVWRFCGVGTYSPTVLTCFNASERDIM